MISQDAKMRACAGGKHQQERAAIAHLRQLTWRPQADIFVRTPCRGGLTRVLTAVSSGGCTTSFD
jgi:hypothetical protein